FLTAILVVTTLILIVLRLSKILRGGLYDGVLLVTLSGDGGSKKTVIDFLKEKLPSGRVESLTENDDESVISYAFTVKETGHVIDIEEAVRKLDKSLRCNVYFNRPGEL
ncbi:MAG: hypothetical protein AAF492_29285, partial [Verrucomicrobiota bacterium]